MYLTHSTLTTGEIVVSKAVSGILNQLIDHWGPNQLFTLQSKTFTDAVKRRTAGVICTYTYSQSTLTEITNSHWLCICVHTSLDIPSEMSIRETS